MTAIPGAGYSANGINAGSATLFPKILLLHPSNAPDKKIQLTMAKNLKLVNKQPGIMIETMPSD